MSFKKEKFQIILGKLKVFIIYGLVCEKMKDHLRLEKEEPQKVLIF